MTIQELIDLGTERNLIEIKEDKIKYLVQNKEYVLADPEEIVRAATYVELVELYKYSPNKIQVEVPVPRRTPNDYADIVVYKEDDHAGNYIVVENKKQNVSEQDFVQAIEQGFGNANSLRAEYLAISNFDNRVYFDVQNFSANERERNIIGDIPINYGYIPTYTFKKGGEPDILEVAFERLSSVFKKCHDIIWSGGKLDPSTAFDEMSKVLFAKIQDERNTRVGQFYKFQIGRYENDVMVSHRVI